MEYLPIAPDDQQLIDAATEVIQKRFLLGKHHVGAAVRASSGKIYSAVHLESKRMDVCAEQIAIGMAMSAGEKTFNTIVAVQMRDVPEPTVIPPCQTCIELIRLYGENADVLVLKDGEIVKMKMGVL